VPRVHDLIIRARHEDHARPAFRTDGAQHGPAGAVATAGEVPTAAEAESALRGLEPAKRREGARAENVRPGREVFILGLLRPVSDHPVVAGPDGIAPGSGATGTA